LSRLLLQEQRQERAIEVLEQLRQLRLAEEEALEALAELYERLERPRDQIAVLAELAQVRPDDLAVRKQLARLCHRLREWKQAAQWAEAALWIDVGDGEAKELLLGALEALGQQAEIQRVTARYQ
jgi:tetratricopeptide (TPR) repeat protein